MTDYDSHDTTPWFDKNVQKICSVVASIATGFFNDSIHGQINMQSSGQRKGVPRLAMFDARCFVMPREDVNNYFVWRQRDATRNSIAMLAQSHFSPSQLHGKNGNQMQEMLFSSKGINWNDIETWKRRGWCAWRENYESAPEVIRTRLVEDVEIPIFSADPSYIQRFVDVDTPVGGSGNPGKGDVSPIDQALESLRSLRRQDGLQVDYRVEEAIDALETIREPKIP